MAEGKLTLPVIHALFSKNQEDMFQLAYKVKDGSISADEIATLVLFTLNNQGIDYAEKIMQDYANKAKSMLSCYPESNVKSALLDYVDYVINRNY
jgi:octaprenyl-diphosphate synthase